jgi:hypothetical protein
LIVAVLKVESFACLVSNSNSIAADTVAALTALTALTVAAVIRGIYT